jgi:hypothetical protein
MCGPNEFSPMPVLPMRSSQMVIRLSNVGPLRDPREKRWVTISVEFGPSHEKMTIEVLVADESDEDSVREHAIARAKDFARKFAANL